MTIDINLKKGGAFFIIAMLVATIAVSQPVKTINGTFVTLKYQDQRNEYMNPPDVNEMNPQFWWTKLKEYSNMGISYIVIQFVADSGEAFYPSRFMPHAYPKGTTSPVDAIMDASNKYGLHVILGAGWAYDQYDDPGKPNTRTTLVKIMKELNGLYKNDKSFYGWYIPAEADLSQIVTGKTMVKDINELTMAAKKIAPDKKVMISPYGIWNSHLTDKRFAAQIKKLKVDIIAYQDEVGCVREPFPIPKMKNNFKKLVQITKSAGIEFWSNIESFTWSNKPNNHYSALIPAPFPRYLSQIVGETEAGAQELISFAIFGIMDDPLTDMPIGQPETSARFYTDYMDWRAGKGRWPLLGKTFEGSVPNKAAGKSVHFYTKPSPDHAKGNLTDNVFGSEDEHDSSWLGFDHGRMIFEVDLDSVTNIKSIALRFLNYKPANIFLPSMTDFYLSKDGVNYWKAGTTIPEIFPNDHLDCWIDLEMLSNLKESARYIKVVANGSSNSWIFCDKILVE